jgi:hypothetical protein
MAITKTIVVKRIDVCPVPGSDARVVVRRSIAFDDATDDTLPTYTDDTVTLVKYTNTTDEDGNETQSLTDYSTQDALVVTVCDAIWS